MCGIIISPDRNKIDSIKHRGIQFTSIEKDGWVYGHHRLPIQTLKEDKWFQPINLHDGFLLFNGEIFNCNEITGEEWENDSQYLQDFFDNDEPIEKKLKEINKWDGFWSIVIVRKNKVIIFTDPLGKKQLYINKITGEVSSEVKGLSNSKIIDPIFISIVNKWGYNTDNRTLYEDVQRIMPNSIYIWEKGRNIAPRIIENYFDWNSNVPLDSIHDLIEKSVQRRLLTKKYKVSTLFSAGLDSMIILYFLKKFGADVNIYSINNAEDGVFVQSIQNKWGLDINYLDVKPEELSLVEKMRIYDINDSMIDLGSVIPQYYLFKDIKDKIVLTGDGADELFGGYRRISEYDSQKSDVFQELPFYHMIRIDRMSMNFTIECRNPFLGHDVVRAALQLPYSERTHKKILKDEFKGLIPDEIIERKKNPLKISQIRENETKYRRELIENYINWKKINGSK
jgi:asparagine synthase (glutamine-hydrolysing)